LNEGVVGHVMIPSQLASSLWDLAAQGELNKGVVGHVMILLNLLVLFEIWQRRVS
jgi:hypothetical protein